jgi:hypothetical protein
MGTGTDVAIESAGITLLKGDLTGIVKARALSAAVMSNIRQNKLTSAPVSAGTCYRFLRRIPTGPAINDVEVTEFVPNSVFTLASRNGPTRFTYRYRLSPQGKNTQLRLEGEINGEGLGRGFAFVAPFAERLFERGMRANLAALKQLLELP